MIMTDTTAVMVLCASGLADTSLRQGVHAIAYPIGVLKEVKVDVAGIPMDELQNEVAEGPRCLRVPHARESSRHRSFRLGCSTGLLLARTCVLALAVRSYRSVAFHIIDAPRWRAARSLYWKRCRRGEVDWNTSVGGTASF